MAERTTTELLAEMMDRVLANEYDGGAGYLSLNEYEYCPDDPSLTIDLTIRLSAAEAALVKRLMKESR